MNYIDTDVLVHSLVNQNLDLHLSVNDLFEEMIVKDTFVISWLNIQEVGFVLAKLGQPVTFVSDRLSALMSVSPVGYGSAEFTRALELAKHIGFKDFNDCIHAAIAEQYCSDLYTCNYKDFERIKPHTSLNIHFL